MTNSLPDVIPFPQRAASPPVAETAPSVLIVTCDQEVEQRLSQDVQAAGFLCRAAASHEAAALALTAQPADVCLVGPLSVGESVRALAEMVQQKGWSTQLVCVIAAATEDSPCVLPAASGVELLHEPYSNDLLGLALNAAAQRSRLAAENRRLRRQLSNRNLRDMVGHSPAMQALRQQVQHVAELNDSLLLRGEPGTGIDLVAQAIHDSSRRAHRPFVKIDCSVLSAETLEQELFGETSAGQFDQMVRQPGRLEMADGGTLVFEQVHQVALPVQKLLVSLIREQRFEHPVSREKVRIDVRFVFGSHANLESLVEKGLFRRDLYDEIVGISIDLPTLRSRKEDIAPLAEHFLRRVSAREGKPARSLTLEALHLLQRHEWPGNIRELENVIEKACALDWGNKLTAAMLEAWITPRNITEEEADVLPGLTLAEMERKLIEATFNRFAGNREKTAKALQIGIRTLSGKLREYGYPPRGGPGSNLKGWTPTVAIAPVEEPEQTQRAA